jgi:orotidine-5'-phosphate decarboxylase
MLGSLNRGRKSVSLGNWVTSKDSISKLTAEERLFIALDVTTLEEVQHIVHRIGPKFRSYKVGLELFSSVGPEVIRWLTNEGCRVFADLKFHDIPNTVAGAAAAMTRFGVTLFNVHCAGGSLMLQKTMETVQETTEKMGQKQLPIVLGVTQLTSTSIHMLTTEIGIPLTMEETVEQYAGLAKKSGLHGVVASAKEAALIRRTCGDHFVILTPGIRPIGADLMDQNRVMTPSQAIQSGANFLVVGRPILRANDPRHAAEQIASEMRIAITSTSL